MTLYSDFLANPYKTDVEYLVEVSAIKLSDGSTATFYFSNDGYCSMPGDSPANTYYLPRLQNALNFTRSIFNQGKLGGETFPGYGTIQLVNPDGVLDYFNDYSFDSQPIIVRYGQSGWALSEFGVIFSGTAQGIEFNNGGIVIRIRDNQYLFQKPLQSLNFAGSGGWEGGVSYAGKKKPVCYGECYGVEPVFIDPANLRFQFHDAAVNQVIAVYDGGVPLAFTADFANSTLLDASSPGAGRYSTCLAEGKFKTGSTPVSVVTMDVKGHATGGYISSVADIIKHIALNRVAISGGSVNTASFTALNALNSAAVGYYRALDTITAHDCIGDLADSIGAYWGYNRVGQLIVGRFTLPTGSSVQTYTSVDVISYEKLPTITPIYELLFGYKRCWKRHDTNQVLGAATAAIRDFLTNEFRFSTNTDTSIQTKWPSALSLNKNSLLVDSSAAATESAREFAIFKSKIDGYKLVLRTNPFQRDIGDEIKLQLSRYGLSSGKNFVIVSMTEDAGSSFIEVEAYG